MPVDENDYTKQAIIDRLERAKEVYENAGNPGGIATASEAINNATLAESDSDARAIELAFNAGDYGPNGGDDFDNAVEQPVDLDNLPDDGNIPTGGDVSDPSVDTSQQDDNNSDAGSGFESIAGNGDTHTDAPEHDEPEHDVPEHDEPEHEEPEHDAPEHDAPEHDAQEHDAPEHDAPDHDGGDR